MNILLTGGTGFIGDVLSRKLTAAGETVHLLVRDPAKAVALSGPYTRIFKGDIYDADSVSKAMKGCNRVYHCAGYAKLWARDKSVFYTINVEGTRNILEEACKQQAEKVVFTSSSAVWGPNPYKTITEDDPRLVAYDNDYDLSKHMAEELVNEYVQKGLNAVIVNPTRVYGPGRLSYSNAFTRLLSLALNGKTVVLPASSKTIGNYAFVNDVADGHIKAMEKGQNGERYILGGENLSYEKLFEKVKIKAGNVKLLRLPGPVMKLAGWIQLLRSALFKTEPAYTPGMLKRYFSNMALSSQKAIEHLGYHITPFDEGLDKTIEFIRNKSRHG